MRHLTMSLLAFTLFTQGVKADPNVLEKCTAENDEGNKISFQVSLVLTINGEYELLTFSEAPAFVPNLVRFKVTQSIYPLLRVAVGRTEKRQQMVSMHTKSESGKTYSGELRAGDGSGNEFGKYRQYQFSCERQH